VRSYAVDLFVVLFDDWQAYEALFPPGEVSEDNSLFQLEYIAQTVVRSVEPALLESDRLYFDSDAEAMMIITPDESVANQIAEILADAWTRPVQIRALARKSDTQESHTS
jgi:hypothetical protein